VTCAHTKAAKYHGGPRPFGYATWKNGKLQVHEGW
jgi:hypothetical protein